MFTTSVDREQRRVERLSGGRVSPNPVFRTLILRLTQRTVSCCSDGRIDRKQASSHSAQRLSCRGDQRCYHLFLTHLSSECDLPTASRGSVSHCSISSLTHSHAQIARWELVDRVGMLTPISGNSLPFGSQAVATDAAALFLS